MSTEHDDQTNAAYPALSLDGRQSNGAFPNYRDGGMVHIRAYPGMQPGQKVEFVMRTKDGEFPETFGRTTVKTFDTIVFEVSGTNLIRLHNIMHAWKMYYTVDGTRSNELIVYLSAGGPL